MALLIECPSCNESAIAPDIGPAYCSCGWQSGKEPSALDRNTIETRTMLALEKIAVALEKLKLNKSQAIRGHHETWHQGSGHPTANQEDCPWCNP